MTETAVAARPAKSMSFAFGEPESVLDRREIAQYFEVWSTGRWFEPPLPMDRLCQAFNMAPHHRSAIALKVNLLVGAHIPTAQLGSEDFERFALDFLQMGNGYLENVRNRRGGTAKAKFAPARHTRAPAGEGGYWFVGTGIGQDHRFADGAIFHLQQPDVAQEVYGLPEWLSALQAGLLNENATLFRRRYYLNGAHMGYILQVTDSFADQETADAIEAAMKQGKGAGNFRNMFLYMPGGSKDGIKVHSIGEAVAKDEFSGIKNISRDDMLAAHRVPPMLIGIVPQNAAGFGKPSEALDTFYQVEICPIMRRMLRMNDWFGSEVLKFGNFSASDGGEILPDGKRIPGLAEAAA